MGLYISKLSSSDVGFQEQVAGKLEMVRKQSRVNFIDLAGSERMASLSVGVRRQESLAINLSLFTLGKVITALAEKKFAPYRYIQNLLLAQFRKDFDNLIQFWRLSLFIENQF